MYKVNFYQEEKEKDLTYDDAFYSCINNENKKWENYYARMQEKYDLCYNVESIIIDVNDIKQMKYDCFSNGLLLKLYLMCKTNQVFDKCEQVIILNNNLFAEELIYNILKSEWLINEELIDSQDELKRRKNYFTAIVEASEDIQDIKIQFRNKLYSYFIEMYEKIKNEKELNHSDKVLRLDRKEFV